MSLESQEQEASENKQKKNREQIVQAYSERISFFHNSY